MTLMDLQDAICEALEDIFHGVLLTAKGGRLVPVQVNKQMIPFIDYINDADGLVRRAPCCTVFVSEVKTELRERQKQYPVDVAMVFLCFVVYDNEMDGQGHRDLMMLYERVKLRFRTEPMLLPCFCCQRDMSFILDSREDAPIFTSAMQLEFDIPIIEAESTYI